MSGKNGRVLAIASVSSFLVYLDVTVVNIAFPDIEASFPDASRSGLAWVLAAYNITFAALLLPGGRLADRLGRKRLFLWGLVVFVGASLGCALAPSPEALIAFRVVQAVGGAALVPASQGLILAAFPLAERARAIALWVAAGAVAAALGPPLGGVIIELADWRWVFAINLPIGIAALIVARSELSESREDHGGPWPDPLGALLMIAAVAALTLGVVQGEEWGWGSAAVLTSIAASVPLAAAVVWRCRRHPAPALDLSLFRSRRFSAANAASVLIGLAFYGQLFAVVLFVTGVWGYGPLLAGVSLAPAPAMAAVAAAAGGRRAERAPLLPMAVGGCLLFAAGALWLVLALGSERAYLTELLPGIMLTGAGGGLGVSMLTGAAAEALPEARYAVGSAVNSATRQFGAALGVAGVVAAIGVPGPAEALGAFDRAFLLIAAGALAASLVATLIRGSRPGREPGPAAPGPAAEAASLP